MRLVALFCTNISCSFVRFYDILKLEERINVFFLRYTYHKILQKNMKYSYKTERPVASAVKPACASDINYLQTSNKANK